MDGFVVVASLLKVSYAVCAIVALIVLTRWLDRRLGITFGKDVMGVIRQDPLATALYFGLRFLACAVLAGMVMS